MSFLGDLERLFAASLYPLRVPIAIGVTLAVLAIAVLAYRRRWHLTALRHPRRTAAVALPVLAVAIPVAWYLASPLFIRTRLEETAPAAVAGRSGQPADAGSDGSAAPAPTGPAAVAPSASTVPARPAPNSPMPRTGQFRGADEFHYGRGRASLLQAPDGRYTLRFEGFSVQNGPDLYVYLSPRPDGYAEGSLELGRLRATDGNFNYDVPAGSDLSRYRSVVIWCKQFAVLFAWATLSR